MKAIDDLVEFARIEVASGDLEPWAEVLRALADADAVTGEGLLWLIKLYNAYDSLGSAWAVFRRWPSPGRWFLAEDADEAATYPCTQERRNLRGGRVLRHLDSYVGRLADGAQEPWLRAALVGDSPAADFDRLVTRLRLVWGTGRQSAFEWAEFLAKAAGFPVAARHAHLWESEGPRRSLQRLYGNPRPTRDWLDARAVTLRGRLAAEGVTLSWEDFETVICDFNVMRDGRYYPGRHLAALREEIEGIDDEAGREMLAAAFRRVIPEPWASIPPGIDPALMTVYRDTGALAVPVPL